MLDDVAVQDQGSRNENDDKVLNSGPKERSSHDIVNESTTSAQSQAWRIVCSTILRCTRTKKVSVCQSRAFPAAGPKVQRKRKPWATRAKRFESISKPGTICLEIAMCASLKSPYSSCRSGKDSWHEPPSGSPGTREGRLLDPAPGQAHRNVRRCPDSDHSPAQSVNAFTMGGIVRDAGLSPEEFRELL